MDIDSDRTVYTPEEDSELFRKHIGSLDLKEKTVLDMGTGTGVLAIQAARQGAKKVTAVDINLSALRVAERNAEKHGADITFIHSDMFDRIKDVFDVIICNTPYLPEDEHEVDDALHTAITGGKHGYEWTVRFISQAKEHLAIDGTMYLLFSTLSKQDHIFAAAREHLFDCKKVAEQPLFFERIMIYCFTHNALSKKLHSLGAKRISFLAQGKRGMVYVGDWQGKRAVFKMKLPKSQAHGAIGREAHYQQKVNKFGVGPMFYAYEDDILIREYIEGERINDYLTHASSKRIREVIKEIFRQARVLDKAGLEKQEMTNPYKHILVNDKRIVMIDFERCRQTEKPGNVTQLVQWLGGDEVMPMLQGKGLTYDIAELRKLAGKYKQSRTEQDFEALLAAILH
jgi:release factor glutamine methyltransferase